MRCPCVDVGVIEEPALTAPRILNDFDLLKIIAGTDDCDVVNPNEETVVQHFIALIED